MRLRTLTVATATFLALGLACPAAAAATPTQSRTSYGRSHYTFAVIGDIPYGAEQVASFPRVVDQINADPAVALVNHLGDIKNGSTECSDAYFGQIRSDFDGFADPLVYTPGDNEWTDCHRPNNGGYNPLERLTAIRGVFFDRPGTSLGQHPVRLASQTRSGYPENVRYRRGGVSFALPHIVGSNNGLAPWTGQDTATPEQTAEVLGRTAAAIELIRDGFESARRHHDRAVVVMTQADMFDPTVTNPEYTDYYAFTPIVRALAEEATDFRGEVYLINGDSHVYNSDRPLSSTSPWPAFYGLARPVEKLQRITVDGSDNNNDYLRISVGRGKRHVLSWTRVPYAS
ncbi:Calcineurin-like phosphoesterase [Friedmanniella luteola]|uniref:Calcineurin-like phosphoesterase n=1 Tax=Friedmanniella luteola TaxID=546871 RepID=A0A1H1T533_9ACTN|nr:metallophosphoesterase [Friedmanniella luteola]SDS55223.1 Calcineurin-like phosphoesterase [Friedmanniella luteola]